MCCRGVFQLKKLHMHLCDYGGKTGFSSSINLLIGSSQGAREFIKSKLLKEFIEKNPQIEFKFLLRRGTHPFITSTYINGYIKDIPLRNYDAKEIHEAFFRARNSCKLKILNKF